MFDEIILRYRSSLSSSIRAALLLAAVVLLVAAGTWVIALDAAAVFGPMAARHARSAHVIAAAARPAAPATIGALDAKPPAQSENRGQR